MQNFLSEKKSKFLKSAKFWVFQKKVPQNRHYSGPRQDFTHFSYKSSVLWAKRDRHEKLRLPGPQVALEWSDDWRQTGAALAPTEKT